MLIFVIMLFVVAAGAEEAGLIRVIAGWVREVSNRQGNLVPLLCPPIPEGRGAAGNC